MTKAKPAENPQFAYQALFPEDKSRSKADKTKSVFFYPQATAEIGKTDFVVNWLEASAKIYKQVGVA